MSMRAPWVLVVFVSLLAVSVAGASEPVKRYTLPAGPASLVAPGVLTVSLPANWHVDTYTKYGSTNATDPEHRASGNFVNAVRWKATTRLMPTGTTLDDIRRQNVFRGPRELWGPKSLVLYQVGDTFLNLPVGKVWRQSLQVVPPKGGWGGRAVERIYWLDRGVARSARTGEQKQLFSIFYVQSRHEWSNAHTSQFEAVMHSIRLAS